VPAEAVKRKAQVLIGKNSGVKSMKAENEVLRERT